MINDSRGRASETLERCDTTRLFIRSFPTPHLSFLLVLLLLLLLAILLLHLLSCAFRCLRTSRSLVLKTKRKLINESDVVAAPTLCCSIPRERWMSDCVCAVMCVCVADAQTHVSHHHVHSCVCVCGAARDDGFAVSVWFASLSNKNVLREKEHRLRGAAFIWWSPSVGPDSPTWNKESY